jgi:hypothetical protein
VERRESLGVVHEVCEELMAGLERRGLARQAYGGDMLREVLGEF